MDVSNPSIRAIHERLMCLEPKVLEILDESTLHALHPGKSTGGHFKLKIQAQALQNQSRLAQHQIIYKLLNDLFPQHIHALQITVLDDDKNF